MKWRFLLAGLFLGLISLSVATAQNGPQPISVLPENTSPPAASYVMTENNNLLTKVTLTNAVNAGVPAPAVEPSCVISSGTCSVSIAVANVHECAANTDSNDTHGPFVVSGSPSPNPSGTPGWTFTATQTTPTSTPTVHFHPVCR